mmetsp:Transcript_17982/g.31228  ORF Transcript_17982/g.31228 Transcript_17982/m.31228 type:complete len:147 (+) Transcript_17982:156-596(+)
MLAGTPDQNKQDSPAPRKIFKDNHSKAKDQDTYRISSYSKSKIQNPISNIQYPSHSQDIRADNHRQPIFQILDMHFHRQSQGVICDSCGEKVMTNIDYRCCNVANWLICLFTGLFCVFIPGCFDCASTVEHTCPVCGNFLGETTAC